MLWSYTLFSVNLWLKTFFPLLHHLLCLFPIFNKAPHSPSPSTGSLFFPCVHILPLLLSALSLHPLRPAFFWLILTHIFFLHQGQSSIVLHFVMHSVLHLQNASSLLRINSLLMSVWFELLVSQLVATKLLYHIQFKTSTGLYLYLCVDKTCSCCWNQHCSTCEGCDGLWFIWALFIVMGFRESDRCVEFSTRAGCLDMMERRMTWEHSLSPMSKCPSCSQSMDQLPVCKWRFKKKKMLLTRWQKCYVWG